MTLRSGHNAMPFLKSFFLFLVLTTFSSGLSAQIWEDTNPWTVQEEATFSSFNSERRIIPDRYLTYRLNEQTLRPVLRNAPLRFSPQAAEEATVLQLPVADGSMERFRVCYAPVLAPGLAARFPNIRSYAGIGIDDPTASVRLDLTPAGFHAMIHSARHGTVYIDPYAQGDTEHYIVYYKKDFTKANQNFACLTEEEVAKGSNAAPLDDPARNLLQGDCRLRTYRLALTCTGEYAQFHGGTVEGVLAAMNTSMTRVNGVFERDVNVTMEIVENNDLLIFLDTETDPYEDGNPGQMIGECHTQCIDIIGSNNFDIGHIFSTQGGGLAGLGVICSPNRKGNGVTGINNPVGDPFDIDYVAHEMGHQFGAGHTQNNDCNRSGFSAMEPGSASTIMGYAGICSPNVQSNSDDYFHAISIQQMSNYINNNEGNNCAVFTETGNNPPTVVELNNYILPIATPFRLTAIGEDLDGDALTYCWEQMDNEVGDMPPQPTNTQGPVFRSFDPTESPTRYFPRLNDLLAGTDNGWESLPAVSRAMSFRVTLRDNNLGSGCTIEDDLELTFTEAAGPFVVQNPNEPVAWVIGQMETVTWDVANTDAAPVSCAVVDILLSLDGGFTYPITLASQVPNNGNYALQVPNQVTTMARVMVVCSDNVFFDISDENFSISEPTEPTFIIEVSPLSLEVCNDVETVDYELDLTPFVGFDQIVNLSATGVPVNATATFSDNDILPTASSTLTISNLMEVAGGVYEIMLNGTTDSISIDRSVELTVVSGTLDDLALSLPVDGAIAQEANTLLTWELLPSASGYFVEIATNPAFGATVIETATLDQNINTYQPQNLLPSTVYYWRIAADNLCGRGASSAFFAFQTIGNDCITYTSGDVPVNISNNDVGTFFATINIPDDLTINTMTSSMEVSHTWVGDLNAVLESPQGVTINLFNQPGITTSNFGCDQDNLLLTFDDAAEDDASVLDATCGNEGGYAINGTFQPVDPLGTYAGSSSLGVWTLAITDNFDQDGGQLESWSLDICLGHPPVVAPTLVNNIFVLEAGTTASIPNSHLLANLPGEDAATMVFTLLSLPAEGTLMLDEAPVAVGVSFTQADINDGRLVYTNTNLDATQDDFRFSLIAPNGGWIPNETFTIQFGTSTLVGASYVSEIIVCAGDTDGQITVNATGPDAPFTYSLDGESFQISNVFTELAAGTYLVTVMDALGNTVLTNTVELATGTSIIVAAMATDNTINVTSTGGSGMLTYSIDGENFQSENEFADLPNGTYEITVMDENGCIGTSSPITINLIQSATIATTSPDCTDNENGVLIITDVVGGESPYQYSIDGEVFSDNNTFEGLSAGFYPVSIMDAQGNIFIAGIFSVEDAPEIVLAIEVIENTIMAAATGGTGELMYSIDGGLSFQDSGTFADLPDGEYIIIAVDANDCTVSSEVITIDIVGVANLAFDLHFSLYPNPVSTQLTLELQSPTARDIRILVYDVAGRLLLEQSVIKPGDYLKTTIDVQHLPAGSYEVIVSDNESKGRSRFVKM
ncbi:reprolysin-like metallopeptidase [Lewinella sp. LCG006]|uniref:reprolysin-like metallopeptidase n=1 Tax=Lewinella sp. LCG006 TaxID=3231911 RepID=UPI00345F6D33